MEKWIKSWFHSLLKKRALSITKNYEIIKVTAILVKIYKAIVLIHIPPKIEKILGNIRTAFKEISL